MKPGSQLAAIMADKVTTRQVSVPFSVEELVDSIPGLMRDMQRCIKRGDMEGAEATLGLAEACNNAADLATTTLRRYTDQLIRILPSFDWGEENAEVFRRYVETTKETTND